MYNILDYLKYYKDTDMNKVKFNDMDAMVCTILTYLPIKSYKGYKTLHELKTYSNKYKKNKKDSFMVPISYEVLELIDKSARYRSMKIYNFECYRDDTYQFGAATFRINNNVLIGFKGTDSSVIGWIENFRILYEYPTITHKVAIRYINDNIRMFDKNVFVAGHSKGGNLAIVSAMELPSYKSNKVKKVYNFDGPGLRKEEFESEKFKMLSKKLVNIVPTGSIIGMIMYNKNYTVVKSDRKGFNEHYLNSWRLFGEFFEEGKLSALSSKFHRNSTEDIKDIKYEDLKIVFEEMFNAFGKERNSKIKLSIRNMYKFYKNSKEVNPVVSKKIQKMLTLLFNIVFFDKKDQV